MVFAHFEKGESKAIRYRIETASNKNMSAEEKELYRESGWEHVTSFGDFNIFSSPTEMNAPELHTDPAEQSFTLAVFDEKIAKGMNYVIILSILIVGTLFATWFI